MKPNRYRCTGAHGKWCVPWWQRKWHRAVNAILALGISVPGGPHGKYYPQLPRLLAGLPCPSGYMHVLETCSYPRLVDASGLRRTMSGGGSRYGNAVCGAHAPAISSRLLFCASVQFVLSADVRMYSHAICQYSLLMQR